jgi:hypothetical protein
MENYKRTFRLFDFEVVSLLATINDNFIYNYADEIEFHGYVF